MSIRKHYLETHRTGLPVQIAAIAMGQAATNEGERVELVGEHAVMIFGDPPAGAVERFAASAEAIARAAPVRLAA